MAGDFGPADVEKTATTSRGSGAPYIKGMFTDTFAAIARNATRRIDSNFISRDHMSCTSICERGWRLWPGGC